MKSSILVLAAIFISAPSFAVDSPCFAKLKNTASFEIAQKLGVAVQSVEVVAFDAGVTAMMIGNNTYSAKVSVRAPNRNNRGLTIRSYIVNGKQIEDTNDCNVNSIADAQGQN